MKFLKQAIPVKEQSNPMVNQIRLSENTEQWSHREKKNKTGKKKTKNKHLVQDLDLSYNSFLKNGSLGSNLTSAITYKE